MDSPKEQNNKVIKKIVVEEFMVPAEFQDGLIRELVYLYSLPDQILTQGQMQSARNHVQIFMNNLRQVQQGAGSSGSAVDGGNIGSKLTESFLDKKDSKIIELYEQSKNKVFKDRNFLVQLDRDLSRASNSLASIIFKDQELLQIYQQKSFELRQPKRLENVDQIAEMTSIIANDLLKTQLDQQKREQLIKIASQSKEQVAQQIAMQFDSKQQKLSQDLPFALKYDLVDMLYGDNRSNPLQEVLKTGKIQVVPTQNQQNKIGLDFIENTNPATQKQIAKESDLYIQEKRKENKEAMGVIDADSLLFDFGKENDQLGIVAQIAIQLLRFNVKKNDLNIALKDLPRSNGILHQDLTASRLGKTKIIYNSKAE